jgi:hypothetical protein
MIDRVRRVVLAAVLPLVAFQFHLPLAAACSEGPQCGEVEYASPNEREFIADARKAGFAGSSTTSVQVPNPSGAGGSIALDVSSDYRDLSQAEANILHASPLLCFAVWGRGGEVNWPLVSAYLGGTPSSTQLYALFDSLKANRMC